MKKQLMLICILIMLTSSLSGRTLTYRDTTGDEVAVYSLNIEPDSENGWSVNRSMYKGFSMAYKLDDSFSVLEWEYKSISQGINLYAKRVDKKIYIKGSFKKKKYDAYLDIDDKPWYEEWSLGLEDFVTSKEEKRVFWSIHIHDIDMLAKFVAMKKGTEMITVDGKEVPALKVEIKMTGMMGGMFKAYYWFRETDGVNLLKERRLDFSGPISSTELIKVDK